MARRARSLITPPAIAPLPLLAVLPPLNRSRTCRCCRWVEVSYWPTNARGSLSCTCPKCVRGQAGEGKDCCYFEREPGADDEDQLPLR